MRQFHELFVGRTDAYGTYALPKGQTAKRGTKFVGKARTVTDRRLTVEQYREHMKGITGLGIVPIIPKVNTVSWFVIDVDEYGEDDLHGDLTAAITRLNLPLVVCKSKSGGAHVFCFLTEPAKAVDVLPIARKYAKKLGCSPKVEIFPKQEAIDKDNNGSWLNLPYFGETRPCMGADGKTELSLKEFLLFAHEREVHPTDLEIRLEELKFSKSESGSKAPPCIDRMIDEGIEEGGRDNALTHVVVYMKKRYPEDWQDRVAEFNSTTVHPSLPFSDVSRIIKGGERKDYQYLCKQQPMCALCNKDACLKREFGVGSGGEETLEPFTIDNIRKICTEEPILIVVVNGTPVQMKMETFLTFRLFKIECAKVMNRVLMDMKAKEWAEICNEALKNVEEEKAPEIVGESGQIRHHFMEWTGQMVQAGPMQRVIEGYPVFIDKRLIFRATDFISYLRRTGARYEDRMIWLVLNEDGAEQETMVIGGNKRKVWTYDVGQPWFDPPENKENF